MIQFSFFAIKFLPTQKIMIPKFKFYFTNWETKTKLLEVVTVKIDFNMCMSFFCENSFVVAVCTCELSWHKIHFSNINWRQLFFLFIDIKFILKRTCVHEIPVKWKWQNRYFWQIFFNYKFLCVKIVANTDKKIWWGHIDWKLKLKKKPNCFCWSGGSLSLFKVFGCKTLFWNEILSNVSL